MNTKKGDVAVGQDILGLLRQRETTDNTSQTLKHRLHVTDSFIHRLVLEKELEGHTGCVNCLEWNETGRILASASDDLHIILWDPFAHKKLQAIHTGHHGNIFSVKFMPKSNDNILVTGAGDAHIRVHDAKAGETTHVCNCHSGRVKRIATAPNVPFLFWSASEDGAIIETDLRAPHTCAHDAPNVLVNLVDHLGRYAEAKCLAVNPRRPELLAVGVNDPYVRVYDRRMVKLSARRPQQSRRGGTTGSGEQPDASNDARTNEEETCKIPQGCVQYFVAGHLPVKVPDLKKRFKTLACTYLTFGADGTELLVNLGGEQIYLFDVNNKRRPKTFTLDVENGYCGDAFKGNPNGIVRKRGVPDDVARKAERLRIKANEAFEQKKYTLAISLYNLAVATSPDDAVLYGNRSAGYLMRMWDGDVYASLRDCLEAIRRDRGHCKAHLRLARCLYELRWLSEADKCLAYYKTVFPLNAKDETCVRLEKDIKKAWKSKRADTKPEKDSDDESSSTDGDHAPHPASTQEDLWRANAYDYEVRFCGHCNTTTDIKECNFFGSDSQFVVAGSDDGSFFIWDRHTTNIVRILKGDDSIVNCLQPHPSTCLLATSGIDPVVRLWSPGPEDGSTNEREVSDPDKAASANQKRMNADPFEIMLLNMGMPSSVDLTSGDSPIQCRPS